MMRQLAILILFVIPVSAQPLCSETFCSLDREVAGLMDSWINLTEGDGSESAGFFVAGTAILRAELAFVSAVACDDSALPVQVSNSWKEYLKSSADCIFQFRSAVGSLCPGESEEVLLASFARWETMGGKFLESVQSTR